MQKKPEDTYCYGLWKSGLPDQLLWYCVEPAQRSYSPLDIPTWSWASTMHGIRFLNIKKAKNVCKDIRFNEDRGTLMVRSQMKKVPRIITPLNPNLESFGKPDDDLTPARYNTFMEEARNTLPVSMACAIYTDRAKVLGWGILDEGERWTPSSNVFCLALMSRKAFPFPTKESSETFKRTTRISWQEDLVMLLQRSSSSTDIYQRIRVGIVFWKL